MRRVTAHLPQLARGPGPAQLQGRGLQGASSYGCPAYNDTIHETHHDGSNVEAQASPCRYAARHLGLISVTCTLYSISLLPALAAPLDTLLLAAPVHPVPSRLTTNVPGMPAGLSTPGAASTSPTSCSTRFRL